MPTIEELEAARDATWLELDAAHRAIPDCEHVQVWRRQIDEARVKHQAAIRACNRALRQQKNDADQAPV